MGFALGLRQVQIFQLLDTCKFLHTGVNAYTWPDLRTYANFAYMQNLHTYANLVMCTDLKSKVLLQSKSSFLLRNNMKTATISSLIMEIQL